MSETVELHSEHSIPYWADGLLREYLDMLVSENPDKFPEEHVIEHLEVAMGEPVKVTYSVPEGAKYDNEIGQTPEEIQ